MKYLKSVLIAVLFALPCTSRAAVDAFLDFRQASPQIIAEASDESFGNTFHTKSVSFNFSRDLTTNGQPAALGTSGANFDPVTVTVDFQRGSESIMKYCAAGTHFNEVILHVRPADGTQKEYLKIRFRNVMIKSSVFTGDEEAQHTFSFIYQSVFMEYSRPENLTQKSTGGVDIKLNREVAN